MADQPKNWDNPDSDPVKDIKEVLQQEFDRGIQHIPTITIHHPDCRVFHADSLCECNCGGMFFPTHKS